MEVEIAGVKQHLRQIVAKLAGRPGIVDVSDKLSAPDAVVGKIFHHHHRQLGIKVMDFYRVLRAVLIVGDRVCASRRARSRVSGRFADAAHVGQGLFDDRPADALTIEHFKHQIEVAIAHFLRADQLRWVVDAGELLRVSHGIVGGEGMVLRHCLDPRILIKPFRRLYFWIPS